MKIVDPSDFNVILGSPEVPPINTLLSVKLPASVTAWRFTEPPDPLIPVRADPSPLKLAAVTSPAKSASPAEFNIISGDVLTFAPILKDPP